MVKRLFAALLIVGILIPRVGFSQTYVKTYNKYTDIFRNEPIEKLVIEFLDGTTLVCTDYEENRTSFPDYILEKRGLKISDITLVIHNHSYRPRPSDADMEVFKWLIDRGFKGLFVIKMRNGRFLAWSGLYERWNKETK